METVDYAERVARENLRVIKELHMCNHTMIQEIVAAVEFNARIHSSTVDSSYLIDLMKKYSDKLVDIINNWDWSCQID